MLLRILMENLGEASSLESTAPKQEAASLQLRAAGAPPAGLMNSVKINFISRILILFSSIFVM